MPSAGDRWRYKVQDQFRLGDLFVTAQVDGVSADGVTEIWTTTSDAKRRTVLVPLEPGFHALPNWTLTPPEFAPYLQAAGLLPAAPLLAGLTRVVDDVRVPLKLTVEGEEDVVVGAGRFRATKLVLRGRATTRGRGPVSAEHVVWYVPAVKRSGKETITSRVGNSLHESTTVELVEFEVR
jgi:hypothetical protein